MVNFLVFFIDSGEHCHDDEAQKAIDNKARRKLWLASIICVIFMLVEAVGESIE